MPTAREQGVALLATVVLGVVALANFNSNDTTKALSNTKMIQPFPPAKVELKENEKDALVHSLLDQQGFLHKYTDIVPISQMAGNLAQPVHLPDADKSAVMLQNNCWLNQLSEQLESSLTNYTDKKGGVFVDGPVTKWTSAYANAAGDVGLQDTDYLKVASAKARFDGMMFYIKISHTVEICVYKENAENGDTVVADPTLFMPVNEATCDKSKAAKLDFETGAGRALIVEGAASPECVEIGNRNTQLQPLRCSDGTGPDCFPLIMGSCPAIDDSSCNTKYEFACQAYELVDRIKRIATCPAMKKAIQEKCQTAITKAKEMLDFARYMKYEITRECKKIATENKHLALTYQQWKQQNPKAAEQQKEVGVFFNAEGRKILFCTELATKDTPYPAQKHVCPVGFIMQDYIRMADYIHMVDIMVNDKIPEIIAKCNV